MINLREHGQEAVEFALITAFIAVASLMVLFIFGGKMAAFFKDGSSVAQVTHAPTKVIDKTKKPLFVTDFSLPASENVLNSTEKNTEMACQEESCNLSLGTIQLTTFQKDMTGIVQTLGASGGTEVFAGYFAEIADQLEDSGQTEAANDVKKLASLGHNVAVIQKGIDDIVKTCNYEKNCIEDQFNKTTISLEGFDTRFSNEPKNIKIYDVIHETHLGLAWRSPESLGGYKMRDDALSYQMRDHFSNVMNNPTLDSSSKSVIQELYWQMGIIGEWNESNLRYLMGVPSGGDSLDDPLTGEPTLPNLKGDPIDVYKNFNAPQLTHYDSALICAAGKNHDSGEKCH